MIAWGGRRLWHRCQNVCLWNFCRYIWRRCCWAVEDYAPGHPHEAWGLKSSRRGNLCAVLVCFYTRVHIDDCLLQLLRFVSPFLILIPYGFGFLIVIPPSTVCFGCFCVSNSCVVACGTYNFLRTMLFCSPFFLILNHEHVWQITWVAVIPHVVAGRFEGLWLKYQLRIYFEVYRYGTYQVPGIRCVCFLIVMFYLLLSFCCFDTSRYKNDFAFSFIFKKCVVW